MLRADDGDKWHGLCRFLDCTVPSSTYPNSEDIGPRPIALDRPSKNPSQLRIRRMKWDRLPWVIGRTPRWNGIVLGETCGERSTEHCVPDVRERFHRLEAACWEVLDDTFPDNLALFRETNFELRDPAGAVLHLRQGGTNLRKFTSASLRSRKAYRYGRFEAEIRPAKGPGLVTGVFLHRNSPRQEIDIEFLGKNTRRLMVNVYYNPGSDGATFEYGYRGTPEMVDLDFDASEGFHRYAIAWTPDSIKWFVDGRLAYERANWDPTPIPHLPMRFFVNLWPPRSKRLAGVLSSSDLPTMTEIRSVFIDIWK